MSEIIGRHKERQMLEQLYNSAEAEFIAVYGRRRVGKTHLIRNLFDEKPCLFFHVTGIKKGTLKEHLYEFTRILERALHDGNFQLKEPNDWMQAFEMLTKAIASQSKKKKIVIFLDELPWLAGRKSRLLPALEYYWNRYWCDFPNVKLIVCGSVASWIIKNIIQNKAGLHNRLSMHMKLDPLNLPQTKEFLRAKGIKYTDKQILDLYMILGGIPFYLKQIDKKHSVAQNIDRLCFQRNGLLLNEFNELYSSLFENSDEYEEIIRIIGKKRRGVSRTEILKKSKLSKDGGTFKKRIKALEDAGFIISFIPYKSKKRGKFYRIIDEYTLFYLAWIEPSLQTLRKLEDSQGYWEQLCLKPAWRSWAGYAFESTCLKHISIIRRALDINITAEIGSWQYIPKKEQHDDGAQIDLLFDRDDDVVTICEIKYHQKPYVLSKSQTQAILNKIEIFRKKTVTKKHIVLAMITVMGVEETYYSEGVVDFSLTLEDLMKL